MSKHSRRVTRRFKKRLRRVDKARIALQHEALSIPLSKTEQFHIADVARHIDVSLIPLQRTAYATGAQQKYWKKLLVEGWDRKDDTAGNEAADRIQHVDPGTAPGNSIAGRAQSSRTRQTAQVDERNSPPSGSGSQSKSGPKKTRQK